MVYNSIFRTNPDLYRNFQESFLELPEDRYYVPIDDYVDGFRLLDVGFSKHRSKPSAIHYYDRIQTFAPFKNDYHILDIEVHNNEDHGGPMLEWFIASMLTPRGKQALAALEQGYVWDSKFHQIDITATAFFYRQVLRMRAMPKGLMDRAAHVDLPSLSKPLLLMKLRGYLCGDWIYESEDAYTRGQYADRWHIDLFEDYPIWALREACSQLSANE